MPTLETKKQTLEQDPPLMRHFYYGSIKTRKTWLAGTAAEAGFNTILLDFDAGYQILLKQLSESSLKRLYFIEASDSLRKAKSAEFITRFLKFGHINFDEKTKSIITNYKLLSNDCIQLSVDNHLNKNTVLIIDSYTALVKSIAFRYAIENKVDLTDPSKTDWEGYGWCGALATWMLDRLSTLPCHIIVIGHKSVYEKYKKDSKGKDVLDWSRIQIKSTSAPHSMTIGDKFTDILYFENISSSSTKISTRAEREQEGGCRLIPPNSYNWEKLQFKDICKYSGVHLPSEDLPYLDFTIPESSKTEPLRPAKPIINSPKTSLVKKNLLQSIKIKKP